MPTALKTSFPAVTTITAEIKVSRANLEWPSPFWFNTKARENPFKCRCEKCDRFAPVYYIGDATVGKGQRAATLAVCEDCRAFIDLINRAQFLAWCSNHIGEEWKLLRAAEEQICPDEDLPTSSSPTGTANIEGDHLMVRPAPKDEIEPTVEGVEVEIDLHRLTGTIIEDLNDLEVCELLNVVEWAIGYWQLAAGVESQLAQDVLDTYEMEGVPDPLHDDSRKRRLTGRLHKSRARIAPIAS